MNPQNSQEALNQLQQYRSSMRSQGDLLNEQNQQLGVNAAQQQVTGLRGAINNTTKMLQRVAPSIMGRTAHSLVNSAQATGQIANAQRPIAQQLSEQGTQFSNANDEYNRLASRAGEMANSMYGDQQNQLSYLQSMFGNLTAREQEAEAKRRWEIERQDRLNAENESRKAAAAQQSALSNYLRNTGTLSANTSIPNVSSTNTTETDAAYLGRLREEYKNDPTGLSQILVGLSRSTNPLGMRRYQLAQQLGLVPSKSVSVTPSSNQTTGLKVTPSAYSGATLKVR